MFRGGLESFLTIPQQVVMFLGAVLLGIGLGIIFDIFRVIRIVFPPAGRTLPTAVCDFIYMIIFGLALFLYSAAAGRGDVRFFYAAGAVLGAVLYILTVGNTVTSAISAVIHLIRRIMKIIFKKKASQHNEQETE